MKQIAAAASLAFAALTAGAQTTTYTQVQHIRTSLNHLTVLELGEPIKTLAVAEPDAFSVEQHGDKVFLKPTRDHQSTNLFVWTATREVSYELDPAGDTASMDVLIRTLPAAAPGASTQSRSVTSSAMDDAAVTKLAGLVAAQVLVESHDMERDVPHTGNGHVGIQLGQVFRARNTTYIRYTIENKTDHPFRPTTPVVEMLLPTTLPSALISHRNHQLRQTTVDSFKAVAGEPIPLVGTASAAKDLAPGDTVTGVVGFRDSSTNPPEIIRIQLGNDTDRPVTAAAVL